MAETREELIDEEPGYRDALLSGLQDAEEKIAMLYDSFDDSEITGLLDDIDDIGLGTRTAALRDLRDASLFAALFFMATDNPEHGPAAAVGIAEDAADGVSAVRDRIFTRIELAGDDDPIVKLSSQTIRALRLLISRQIDQDTVQRGNG